VPYESVGALGECGCKEMLAFPSTGGRRSRGTIPRMGHLLKKGFLLIGRFRFAKVHHWAGIPKGFSKDGY